MNKKEMLINFNHAFMAYKDFLYGYYNNELYSNDNLDFLLCLFSSLTFLLNIESLKTKDESPSEYINQDMLIEILQTIVEKKEDGYYLQETFISSSPEEVIKVIRNKIAHGDFLLNMQTKEIILNYHNQDLKINIDDFIAFTIYIIERINLYTNSQNYTRNNLYANTNNLKPLKHRRDIDKFLQNIYFIEYNFNNVTPYDKEVIEEILKKIPSFLVNYESINHQQINNFAIRNFFASFRLSVNPNIISLYQSSHLITLKQFILENFKELTSLNLNSQVSLISQWFYKLERNKNSKDNLIEGIHYNIRLLSTLKNNHSSNINEVLYNSNSPGLQSSLIEMIITNDLLGFYVHYHYPLENLCKDKDEIGDVYFDCSKLDLSSLKPTVFIPPKGQINSYEQAAQGCQRRVEEIKLKINSANKQRHALYNKLLSVQDEIQKRNINIALKTIESQIATLQEKYQIELASLEIIEKNIAEFSVTTKESYRYNRYLIEYIRNSIAHGFVYFDYSHCHGNSQKCQIRFLNIHNQQELFDMTISLTDFENLFNYHNMQVFNNYLKELEKGKSK